VAAMAMRARTMIPGMIGLLMMSSSERVRI
jgi:hypothetical protein